MSASSLFNNGGKKPASCRLSHIEATPTPAKDHLLASYPRWWQELGGSSFNAPVCHSLHLHRKWPVKGVVCETGTERLANRCIGRKKLAVFVSGGGLNFRAIHEAVNGKVKLQSRSLISMEHKLYVAAVAALCEDRLGWRQVGAPLIRSREDPKATDSRNRASFR